MLPDMVKIRCLQKSQRIHETHEVLAMVIIEGEHHIYEQGHLPRGLYIG